MICDNTNGLGANPGPIIREETDEEVFGKNKTFYVYALATTSARGIMFSGCPQYLRNALRDVLQIWHKSSPSVNQ